MHSIRTRITMLTVCMVVIAVIIVTLLSVVFIVKAEHRKSDQLLLLLCETGERNLDYYFSSVEKSVRRVSTYVEEDLDGIDDESLEKHMERVGRYFDELAYKTNGVLTYYYRIDPEISYKVKGFWYTNLDGEGFVEHEPTDITRYDTADTSRLVWFTVPKHDGKPIWLPPYITDNLDRRVISYNEPIYWKDQFVGVVGIEIDYSTMAEQVESINLYKNGYAFISDEKGDLVFHPRIDVASLTENTRPRTPEGLLKDSTFVQYSFQGVEKQAAWLELCNGMHLYVTVPRSEINGDWQDLAVGILVASLIVLLVFCILSWRFTSRITRPLQQLTEAAEQVDRGNYDFTLDYDKDDEVGRLTNTFKRLAAHMKDHITDLNKRVYVDALTSVKNKAAYSDYIETLQEEMDDSREKLSFAVGVFDCDDLKGINDQYGHEKGDTYLKGASRLICRIYQHSPVFRIGGDEFSVIMKHEDYANREELAQQFEREMEAICADAENKWERVQVTMGYSVYDPENDKEVTEVVRRADKAMYENKRRRKSQRSRIHG